MVVIAFFVGIVVGAGIMRWKMRDWIQTERSEWYAGDDEMI